MGPAVAAMAGRPTPRCTDVPGRTDLYERVQADTFHIGGWYDIFTRRHARPVRGDARRSPSAPAAAPPPADRPVDAQLLPRQRRAARLRPGRVRCRPRRPRRPERRTPALVRRHAEGRRGRARRHRAGPAVRHGRQPLAGFERYPVPGTRVEDWHLHPAAGSTAPPRPTVQPDTYVYDPATRCPRVGGSTMLAATLPPGPFDQRDIEARPGRAVLHQRTARAALHRARRRVGHPLSPRRPHADTDFVARLVDVHPDGRAFNVVGRHHPRQHPRDLPRARRRPPQPRPRRWSPTSPTGSASTSGPPGYLPARSPPPGGRHLQLASPLDPPHQHRRRSSRRHGAGRRPATDVPRPARPSRLHLTVLYRSARSAPSAATGHTAGDPEARSRAPAVAERCALSA